MASLEEIKIPKDFGYENVPGLSSEVKQKLASNRPVTLGHASRISGITPAAVGILSVYLKRSNQSLGEHGDQVRVAS